MTDLAGKVVVITGAARGIGFAVAECVGRRGGAVVIVDVDEDATLMAADSLRKQDIHALHVVADVADEDQVVEIASRTEGEIGTITTWINNAGIIRPSMLVNMTVADFDLVLRVHVRGSFIGVREAARRMKASGTRGSIINVTSAAGLNGTIGQINYSAAKGAITSMTKSAARELGKLGIRVNAMAPNAATTMTEKIRTDERLADQYLARIPLGRWAEPEEVAQTFAFLVSDESSYITGQVLCADGGMYMAS